MDPFQDLSSQSDDELRDRLTKIQSRIYAAHAYGMSYDMRSQLENLAQQIQDQLLMRHMVEVQQMWDDQFPDVIISDAGYDDAEKLPKTKAAAKQAEQTEQAVKPAPKFQKVYKKTK